MSNGMNPYLIVMRIKMLHIEQ